MVDATREGAPESTTVGDTEREESYGRLEWSLERPRARGMAMLMGGLHR